MSLNETPVSERVQIGFLGNVNAGKSSIINAITGQNISVVSEFKGTTTDTVKKTMELSILFCGNRLIGIYWIVCIRIIRR